MPHTLIIAEAGVNHNGSLALAKQLVDVAAEAGADYVKFQTFQAKLLASSHARLASYQEKNTGRSGESQYDMLKKLELTPEQHVELNYYAGSKNIKFLSTAFDLESVDFLAGLQLGLWKIPSGEITDYPYLKKIAALREPVILSTGMCTLPDIEKAVNVLLAYGVSREQITILHCNTEYPTPPEDVNLKAMLSIGQHFRTDFGYSDHTVGIEIPIAAVALGAKVIEKHFTLDRNLEGPDHKASLEPAELKAMVSAIRKVEMALGDGEKRISASEAKNRIIARKSIVAACAIKAGEVFTENNMTVKRPGNGISPMEWEKVVGQTAKRDFLPDDLIEL